MSRASVRLAKTNASHSQFLDGFDQLLHRARQAVELPHDQRVAAAREFQRFAQRWPIRNRARQLLIENPPASRFGESQAQAMQGAVFFYLPSMLLSGFMLPFQGKPSWAQALGEVLPLTHFARAARSALLKGQDGSIVVHEIWPIGFFGLVAAAVALAAWRRRPG